jgi:hypothetical protein
MYITNMKYSYIDKTEKFVNEFIKYPTFPNNTNKTFLHLFLSTNPQSIFIFFKKFLSIFMNNL